MQNPFISETQMDEIKKSGFFDKAINYIASILQKGGAKQQYADTLVFNEFGELLIMQRSSTDDFEPSKWCLPGGKIEAGESTEVAAQRELEEETALQAQVSPVKEWENESAKIFYFTAQVAKSSVLIIDTEEHHKYEWVALKDLCDYELLCDLKERLKEIVDIPEKVVSEAKVTEDEASGGKIEEIKQAFDVIQKGFDAGLVTEEQFLNAYKRHNYLLSLNVLEQRLNKGEDVEDLYLSAILNGSTDTESLIKAKEHVPLEGPSDLPEEDEEEEQSEEKPEEKGGEDDAHEGTGLTEEELLAHAKKTSLEMLQNFIKQSDDHELRTIAHKEISRREAEEKNGEAPKEAPAEDKPKAEATPQKPQDGVEEAETAKEGVETPEENSDEPESSFDGFDESEVSKIEHLLDNKDSKNPFAVEFDKEMQEIAGDDEFNKEIEGVQEDAKSEDAESNNSDTEQQDSADTDKPKAK